MDDRVILHCDCNSFFASVETVLNPEYRNVPMAVCGSQSDRHGIVLAKNELAKKYKIQTAETVYSAKKKCPSLVIASPHYSEYSRYSKIVNEIYSRYTDLIEPFGIDESWLDVTASRRLFGSGEKIAEEIRSTVKKETGLTVSIGVSFNKIFAKLGSDYKKPDAVTVISKENFRDIVFPLPVTDLLFVGKYTSGVLASMGIRTIGALAMADKALLEYKLGKAGELLYNYANGLDTTPVTPPTENAKSISNGFTFRQDLLDKDRCKIGIDFLCEEIGMKLRSKKLKCATVALSIKDSFFRTIRRQKPVNPPTDLKKTISDTAYRILLEQWDPDRRIRMLTVSVSNLSASSGEQLSFFDCSQDEANKKEDKIENAIDNIRQKFGNTSIVNSEFLTSDFIFGSDEEE